MTKKNNGHYRLKVTTACQNCQRRKIKCSGEIPCTYCLKVERPCEPGKPGKKRGPPPGTEVLRSRSNRMETVYYSAIKDPQLKEQLRHLYDGIPGARFSSYSHSNVELTSINGNLPNAAAISSSTTFSPIVEPQNDSTNVMVSSDAGLSKTTTTTPSIPNVDSSNPTEVPSNPDEVSSDSADVPHQPTKFLLTPTDCSVSSNPSGSSSDVTEVPSIPVEVSSLPDEVSSNHVKGSSGTAQVSSSTVEISNTIEPP
ncbi:7543_t:CDS:2 [Funneliformis geosporum]|nr:7543_t:CDS:2 [Funneliformis geosporum]